MVADAVFITIEGGEGVGKTLFTQGLKDKLTKAGKTVVTTREPGGTPSAQAIRELFLKPPGGESLAPLTELFLVSAARHQHVANLIQPALQKQQWVICDRYVDSSRVYQGMIAGIGRETLEQVAKLSIGTCEPQLTFLLDCNADIAIGRLQQRGQGKGQPSNRYDGANLSFHRQLRDKFLNLAREYPARIVVLDASRDPMDVLSQGLGVISEKFGISFE